MTDRNQISTFTLTPNSSPDWLDAVLRSSLAASENEAEEVSAEFRERCRKAGQRAYYIARLRAAMPLLGFLLLPFADYLKRLAALAGLPQIPEQLGLANPPELTLASARPFAHLAKQIGMNLQEVLIQVRVGVACSVQAAALQLIEARCRSAGTTDNLLIECEAELRQIESQYSPEVFRELQQIQQEIRQAWNEQP
jgi:hypothetical protein